MYTLVLMAVLSSGESSPGWLHNHQQTGYYAYSCNFYSWGGDGCDWFPSHNNYPGNIWGGNAVDAWAAYARYCYSGSTAYTPPVRPSGFSGALAPPLHPVGPLPTPKTGVLTTP